MIKNINKNTKLADIIIEQPNVISALELLNIRLGFGDSNLQNIAIKYNFNYSAFENIIKVYYGGLPKNIILSKEALRLILSFLYLSHNDFKNKQIPVLSKLIHSFSESISVDHGKVLKSFYDGYIEEMEEHFTYEDETVFPYISTILTDIKKKNFEIVEFEKNHTDIEQKLLDLKNILIKYIPYTEASDIRILILKTLLVLENGLYYHTLIEDEILIPSVKNIEKSLQ